MIFELTVLFILIILSAFFSGSETALLSINDYKLNHLIEKKHSKRLQLIKHLRQDKHKLLTGILIANNVINLSASALATTLALKLFGSYGPAISTGVLTFLILVFGEITPKAFATTHPISYSKLAVYPLNLVVTILSPIIFIFQFITKLLIRNKVDGPKISEEELKSIIKLGEKEGSIDKEEKEMIDNILEFDDKPVSEIMIPRTNIYMLNANITLKQAIPEIVKSTHSRIPIYKGNKDNIIGIIHIKSLIGGVHESSYDSPLSHFAIKPLFIHETLKINHLLNKFKKEKVHIAIVVDEYGGVEGIVTIEDVLEEIVGEIYDESDEVKVMIKKISDKQAIVDGEIEIEDLQKKMNLDIEIEDGEDIETISGYILYKVGYLPKSGDKIKFSSFDAVIVKADERKIRVVKIIKN